MKKKKTKKKHDTIYTIRYMMGFKSNSETTVCFNRDGNTGTNNIFFFILKLKWKKKTWWEFHLLVCCGPQKNSAKEEKKEGGGGLVLQYWLWSVFLLHLHIYSSGMNCYILPVYANINSILLIQSIQVIFILL